MHTITKLNGKLDTKIKECKIIGLHFCFYKMSNNLTSHYLSSFIRQPFGAISRDNLRNSNVLQTLEARLTLYYHSFLSSTIRGWNRLSEEVKSCDSITSLKHQLKRPKQSQTTITLVDEEHKFYTHAYERY